MRETFISSTSWQNFKRESDKILWVFIFGNLKSKIAMAVNKWWYRFYLYVAVYIYKRQEKFILNRIAFRTVSKLF